MAGTKPSALSDSAIRKIGFDPSGRRVDSFRRQISSLPQPRLARDISVGQEVGLDTQLSGEALASQRKARILLDRSNISLDPSSKKFDLKAAKKEAVQYKKGANKNIFDVIEKKQQLEEDDTIELNSGFKFAGSSSSKKNSSSSKASRLASMLGLTSADVKKAAERGSKFDAAAEAELLKRRDAYFDEQEKKEKVLAKLDSIREIKVTAFDCRKCGYISQSVAKGCREMGHQPERISNATKRFFSCCNCNYRCEVINAPYPSKPCSRCSGADFKPCSMLKSSNSASLTQKLVITDESIPCPSSNRHHGL